MNLRALITLLLLLPLGVCAQQFTDASVIGGYGEQNILGCFKDRVNSTYLFVRFTTNNFTVDSLGTSITIAKNSSIGSYNTESYAIIKYNSNKVYQYHLRFSGNFNFNYLPSITFNSQNDIILSSIVSSTGVINFYGSNGVINTTISPQASTGKPNCLFIAKVSESGNYQWIRTIVARNLQNGFATTAANNTYVNHSNQIHIGIFSNVHQAHTADTFWIKNNNIIQDTIISQHGSIIAKFSDTGSLISTINPYKSLRNNHTDSLANKQYAITGNLGNIYLSLNVVISARDTLETNTSTHILDTGNNVLLLKINDLDSLVWCKPMVNQHEYYYGKRPEVYLNFDSTNKEILLSLCIDPSISSSLINNFNPTDLGTNLNRITENGVTIWSMFLKEIYYTGFVKNYLLNQTVIYGQANPNSSLSYAIPSSTYYLSTYFFAFINKTNQIHSITPIISNTQLLSSTILTYRYWPTVNYLSIDNNGKMNICGYFYDSISLPCKTLYSTPNDYNNYGQKLSDGFLLEYSPILAIDTAVCKRMISPSGKYTWDSTAYYFDTIPNKLGCDSTLLFYVKVMQHKVSIDTTVKVSMQSPSGKYIWDSTATYTDTLTNTFGCDSILTFNVKVLQNSTFIDTSVCLFFKLSTSLKAFYQTGNFIDTLTNRLGGDSIVYIKLTILKSTAIIDTSFCNKILSPSGKFWLNNTGAYTDTLMNKHNCDSIITIRFTRLPMMDTIRLSACKPLGSPSGKFVMNETRWYTDTLVSSKGCDSILQIDYTQIRITDTIVLANCNAALSPSNKFVMQQSGWYTDTLITTNGCDSIIRINFTLLKSASSIVLVACDSLISPSGRLVFNAPGVYTDTITNAAGCDSIITINLTFSNSQISVSKSNDISCENQSAVLTASGGSVYVWQPSTGLSNTQISNPIASPNQTTQYTVIATDAYGCKLLDTISVYVNILDSVNNIPNVITPNNDGLNDCISAENIAQFNTCSFVILSRWGNVVWQTNNPKNNWCGTTENGQETAEGTYYYILKGTTLCNQKINSTGTITVIR